MSFGFDVDADDAGLGGLVLSESSTMFWLLFFFFAMLLKKQVGEIPG